MLLELTHRQARNYRESFLGEEEEILLEEPVTIGGVSYFTGHTMRYVEGMIPAGNHFAGEIVRGTVRKISEDGMRLILKADDENA